MFAKIKGKALSISSDVSIDSMGNIEDRQQTELSA